MTATAHNLTAINRGLGTVKIHVAGCADLKKDAKGASIWDINNVTCVEDIVRDVCQDMIDEGGNVSWEDFMGDIDIVACVPGLPFGRHNVTDTPDAPVEMAVETTPTAGGTRHPHTGCGHAATPKDRAACRKVNTWDGTAWVARSEG